LITKTEKISAAAVSDFVAMPPSALDLKVKARNELNFSKLHSLVKTLNNTTRNRKQSISELMMHSEQIIPKNEKENKILALINN